MRQVHWCAKVYNGQWPCVLKKQQHQWYASAGWVWVKQEQKRWQDEK